MFKKFSHPMLYVNDLQRAVAFYKDKLGFDVSFHHPKAFASLFHKNMGCRLDLHPTESNSKDVGFGPIIYFITENMDRDIATLKELGVKVGEPRREGNSPLFVTFWDSEGNTLGLEEDFNHGS
jgi:catechol 2,3-dioxygenase-like lactoylglutathione lyase family enzyme